MNILIIEDQGPEAYLLASLCEGVNRKVDLAFSLPEAWKRIRGRLYEIVFLDLSLPPSLARETLKAVPQLKRLSKVVIVTGNQDPELRASAKHLGADEFIIKHDPNFADKVLAQLSD